MLELMKKSKSIKLFVWVVMAEIVLLFLGCLTSRWLEVATLYHQLNNL